MSRCIYEIISEKQKDEEGILHTVYGIKILGDETLTYRDLCTDEGKIENLVSLLSDQQPELISFPDIIDDFLY